jgi:hypothetical protein
MTQALYAHMNNKRKKMAGFAFSFLLYVVSITLDGIFIVLRVFPPLLLMTKSNFTLDIYIWDLLNKTVLYQKAPVVFWGNMEENHDFFPSNRL